jgi:protein ImuB
VVERVSPFACVQVPYFAAAAAERCEPAVREHPLAIVAGAPPATRVVEANATARERGVLPGLADAEARARCPGLARRPARDEIVASAQHALLEACLAVSPRVEDAGPGLVHVDTAGLGRLIGPDDAVGRRLVSLVRAVGLEARVGLAATRAAARIAARIGARVNVVPPGGERQTLGPASLTELELPDEIARTLERWGLLTLGELAALPRDGVAARLGAAGLAAHDLACGRDREPFRPWAPPPSWEEAQGLEWELDSLGALAAVLEGVLERLAARLAAAHLLADALDVRLHLASGGRHARAVTLAAPMGEVRPMLTLLVLDLESHPPPAPVIGVAVSARVVPRRAVAAGLWERSVPTVRDLAAVLTRLAELVGRAGVGAPVVSDSHHPDAHTLIPFAPLPAGAEPPRGGWHAGSPPTARSERDPLGDGWSEHGGGALDMTGPAMPQLVLRRLRPPREVEVETDAERRPAVVRGATSVAARVVTCAGPWRISGEWWDTRAWARDEWDVALSDGALCRLVRDARTDRWALDGVYD